MHLTGWRLNAGDELTVMDGSNARLVSVNCGGPTGRTVKEGEDCARLIAAAPELLEALVEAKRELWMGARHQWTMADFKNWAVVQQIDVAIAKARGAA